jgi:hypothetical protein
MALSAPIHIYGYVLAVIFFTARRGDRKDGFSFHLPLRGPGETGCKQRQMKNNRPPAEFARAIEKF